MEDHPETTMEFEAQFNSEEACQKYLIRFRWPEGFICPHCQHKEAWKISRGLFHCKNCDLETSVTAGAIFHRAKMPLQLWFRAMWHITNQKYGISALGLQRALGLGSYRTAWSGCKSFDGPWFVQVVIGFLVSWSLMRLISEEEDQGSVAGAPPAKPWLLSSFNWTVYASVVSDFNVFRMLLEKAWRRPYNMQ
jgi:ribosomal protein L37AE/L43A